MNTLETLLTILDGQQLSPGYLTPAGNGTAHDTLRALKQGFDPYTLLQTPIARPALLFTPAHIAKIALPPPGGPPPVRAAVQNKAVRSTVNQSTFTMSLNSASTAGNTLTVGVFILNGTGYPPILAGPLVGTGGNAYSPITPWIQVPQNNTGGINVWYVQLWQAYLATLPSPPTTPIAITVNTTIAQGRLALAALEVSGLGAIMPADPLSIVVGADPAGVTGTISLSPVISAANEFAVAALVAQNILTAGSGWALTQQTATDNCCLAYYPAIPLIGLNKVTPATLSPGTWAGAMAAFGAGGTANIGQDGIFLDGVDGNLDLSHNGQPAYLLTQFT